MKNITLKVRDTSRSVEVPWKQDLNVQEVLEMVADQEKAAGRSFEFAVQYFGYYNTDYLGYLVIMIDKIYDNPKDTNDYWFYYVNGNPAQVGIDNFMVNAGDVIEFDYVPIAETSPASQKAKHEFYQKN